MPEMQAAMLSVSMLPPIHTWMGFMNLRRDTGEHGRRKPAKPATHWFHKHTGSHRHITDAKMMSNLLHYNIKQFRMSSRVPALRKELQLRFQSSCVRSRGWLCGWCCGSQTRHKAPRWTAPGRGASVPREGASTGVYSDPTSEGCGTARHLKMVSII